MISFLKNGQSYLRQFPDISVSNKYIIIICINCEVVFIINYKY
jgi:hypothetical protein